MHVPRAHQAFMHLYLQTPPATGAAPRYCRIALEQDLLGGWTLYRESGTEGGRVTLKREVYLDREAALTAFEQARDAQLKRGFKVMITQGSEYPHG
jgi:hypothetical protein